MTLLTERYANKIRGQLSCYDRIVIQGTLPGLCYAQGMTSFLGRKLHGNYQDPMGNNFDTRIEGTRIKHSMSPVSIKMYDKFALALRIESTVNNVS